MTGLGAGYLPLAPGTWGSLEGVAVVLAVHLLLPAYEVAVGWALVVALGLPGLFFSARVLKFENGSDPSRVVIDEIVGQIFTLLWVPVSAYSLVAGFLLFRLFDIAKPFPVKWSEKLPGGFGILCDDLIAGVYAGIALKILFWFTTDN